MVCLENRIREDVPLRDREILLQFEKAAVGVRCTPEVFGGVRFWIDMNSEVRLNAEVHRIAGAKAIQSMLNFQSDARR